MSFEKLIRYKDIIDGAFPRGVRGLDHICPTEGTTQHLDRFLSDYNSNFFEHDGNRLHFVDTGKGRYARTALCLHSRLGWAYSFRKIIPKLVYHGFRVVAADLLGFGQSDKTADTTKLGIKPQSERIKALIEHLDLNEVTLIGHEMGASVTSQLPRMLPDRIDTLIFANPANRIAAAESPGLHMWRTLMNVKQELDIAAEIKRVCPNLNNVDLAAYSAPIVTKNGLCGVRHFNSTITLSEADPDHVLMTSGYQWLREEWLGRTLIIAGTEDTMFGVDAARQFCEQIGCQKGVIPLKGVCGHPFEEDPDCIDLVVNELFAAR